MKRVCVKVGRVHMRYKKGACEDWEMCEKGAWRIECKDVAERVHMSSEKGPSLHTQPIYNAR